MNLTAKGKYIDTEQIERLFTQGEKFADKVHFYIDKKNNDIDVSSCSFVMRAVNRVGNMVENALEKSVDDYSVKLTWNVSDEMTAVDGLLLLEIVGTLAEQTVIKYQLRGVIVKKKVFSDGGLPEIDIIEDKINSMNAVLEQAQNILDNVILHEVNVDATLSIAGDAADAAETGKQLASHLSRIKTLEGINQDTADVQKEVKDARTAASWNQITYDSLSARLNAEFANKVGQSLFEQSVGGLSSRIGGCLKSGEITADGHLTFTTESGITTDFGELPSGTQSSSKKPLTTSSSGAYTTVTDADDGSGWYISVMPRVNEQSENTVAMTSSGLFVDGYTKEYIDAALLSIKPLTTSSTGAYVTVSQADDGSGCYISVIPRISASSGNTLSMNSDGIFSDCYSKSEIDTKETAINKSISDVSLAASKAASSASDAIKNGNAAYTLARQNTPLSTDGTCASVTVSPASDGSGSYLYVVPKVSATAGNIATMTGKGLFVDGYEKTYIDAIKSDVDAMAETYPALSANGYGTETIIYIDSANGKDSNSGESASDALKTFTAALAKGIGVSRVQYVLAAGSYSLANKYLTLINTSMRITGAGSSTTTLYGNLYVRASNLSIENLTIDSTSSDTAQTTNSPIMLSYGSACKIAGCVLNAASLYGMQVSDLSNMYMYNTVVSGYTQRIGFVYGGCKCTLYDVTDSANLGIVSQSGSTVILCGTSVAIRYKKVSGGVVISDGAVVI